MDFPKAWGGRVRWSSQSLLVALLLTISSVVVHGAFDSCAASTPTRRTSTAMLKVKRVRFTRTVYTGPNPTDPGATAEPEPPEPSRKPRPPCPINQGNLKKDTTGVLLRRATTVPPTRVIEGLKNDESGDFDIPDQALCVGKKFILEGVNNAWALFNKDGGNRFLTFNTEFSFFGATSIGEPKCFFDEALNTFFLVSITSPRTIDVATFKDGDFFKLSDPVYVYTINYDLFPDNPQIGSDKFGFWVSTNMLPVLEDGSFGNGTGVDVVGIDKVAMSNGWEAFQYKIHNPMYDEDGDDEDRILFSLQPQRLQPGSSPDTTNGGMMYFISNSIYVEGEILISAVTNTENLAKGLKPSGLYTLPLPTGTAIGYSLPKIDQPNGKGVNDFGQKMLSAAYAAGKLYATSMSKGRGKGVAIAYYVTQPVFRNGALKARVLYSDTIGDSCGNHMVYPSVGVDPYGNAVIAFSYTGKTSYPSVCYVPLTKTGSVGPEFYCVLTGAENSFRDGWGEFSAAQYDPYSNRVFFATLTAKDQWTTWISSAAPSSELLPASTQGRCPVRA